MSSTNLPESANGVGLGYGIAIAVGILVLISTIMLTSYVCVKVKSHGGGSGGGSGDASNRDGVTAGSSPEAMVVVVGLDGQTIKSFPELIVGESKRLPEPNKDPCPICLAEYLPKQILRTMPDCKHCFHAECIDEWLRMSATCPLCRNSPVPTPVATPLSELVPLALHTR